MRPLEQISDIVRDEDLDAAVVGQADGAQPSNLFQTNHIHEIRGAVTLVN